MLLDIIGEKTTESVKVLGLDDQIGFGKYKDMTLKEVIIKDWQYVKWAIIDSQHFYTDVDKVLEYHMENRPTLNYLKGYVVGFMSIIYGLFRIFE